MYIYINVNIHMCTSRVCLSLYACDKSHTRAIRTCHIYIYIHIVIYICIYTYVFMYICIHKYIHLRLVYVYHCIHESCRIHGVYVYELKHV